MRKIVLCILVVNILFSSCSKPDLKIEKLTIVYSGNIGGQKNPCGCNPTMGGFARKSTVVKGIKSEYENVIVLDSGAMLYATNFLSSPLDYIFKIDARASAQAVDEIGIDAVNLSSFDLTNSVDSLLAIDRETSYPWLSSNLIWRDSGEFIFKPDTILSKGNIRIGVFGIMSNDFMGVTLFNDNSTLKVLDPVETAEKEVTKLKKESDLIIALAYLNMDKTQELCEKVSGIDIVILSNNGYHNPSADHSAFTPIKKGKTLIIRCPDGGRVVGYIDLEIVNNSTDFTEAPEQTHYNQKEDTNINYRREIGSTYKNYFFDLGPEIKEDIEIQEKIDVFEKIIQAYKDSLGIM